MSARLAWSSGPDGSGSAGAACKRCARTPCICAEVEARPPSEHDVRVRIERAGRGGKTVTVAGPLFVARHRAEELLLALKRSCGCGGTLRVETDGTGAWLELQGDRALPVLEHLSREGFRARRGGG